VRLLVIKSNSIRTSYNVFYVQGISRPYVSKIMK